MEHQAAAYAVGYLPVSPKLDLLGRVGYGTTKFDSSNDATGQLVTGSFMDYAIPRADDVPSYAVDTRETPCTHNPLGVKGCGEAGAIGAPAALMNAITDALGVKDMPMPATPQAVWTALKNKK